MVEHGSGGYGATLLLGVALKMTTVLTYYSPIQTGLDPRNNSPCPDKPLVSFGFVEPAVLGILFNSLILVHQLSNSVFETKIV